MLRISYSYIVKFKTTLMYNQSAYERDQKWSTNGNWFSREPVMWAGNLWRAFKILPNFQSMICIYLNGWFLICWGMVWVAIV